MSWLRRRFRLWYVDHFDQAWRFGPHRLRDRFIPIRRRNRE